MEAKTFKLNRRNQSQLGLSLIELMVALGLGVFLLAGLVQTSVSNRQAFEVIQSSTGVQNSARFSFEFMSKTLRMAGYFNGGSVNDDFAENLLTLTSNDKLNETFWVADSDFEEGAVVDGSDSASAVFSDGQADTDSVSIRLLGDPDNNVFDCTGQAIVANSDYETAKTEAPTQISYYIDTNNNLACSVSGAAAVPLVNGIENMQIRYGLSENLTTPERYLNASDMSATDWANVTTIAISILARSESTALNQTDGSTFQLQDQEITTAADGRSRQTYSYTIALKNRTNI